jgi:hypothetical protein
MRSAGQKKKALGSQRKSLKRLDPAKEIQGNPSLFLGVLLGQFCSILLDLAEFGFGLERDSAPRPSL